MSVLVTWDVFMEVGQAAGCCLSDVAEFVPRHHVGLQVVCQGALEEDRQRKETTEFFGPFFFETFSITLGFFK